MADIERKEKKSGWRMVWEALQTVGAGAGILALQHAMEETLTGAGKKAGEVVSKKIGDAFGLTSEEAEKTDDDEISLGKVYVRGMLNPDEVRDIKIWIEGLRNSSETEKLADEFVRRIHNALVKSIKSHEIETGTKDKPRKKTVVDDTEGMKIAVGLIRDILAEPTKERKLAILKREKIKIPVKKPTPAADAVKRFGTKTKEKIKETGEKVTQDQKVNFANLGSFAETAHTNAKQRLKDAFDKRRK
ncbi:MAG: hypothetical protein WC678_04820 [Parcubacteria group bacterium]|jgi:hypothetical protein